MSKDASEIAIDIAREAYTRNELVLFVGAGVSQGSNLPGWAELLRPLAAELGESLTEMPAASDLIRLAKRYEIKKGRATLDRRIREALNNPGIVPNIQHHLIAESKIDNIYTTNYDSLIEQSFRDKGKVINKVVRQSDVRTGFPRIVKICGDLQDANTMVSTFEDYQYFERDKETLMALLKADLFVKCFLFIGYSLNDPFLEKLCLEALRSTDRRFIAVAIAMGWPEEDVELWEHYNVKCIRLQPTITDSGAKDYNTPIAQVLRCIFRLPASPLENPLAVPQEEDSLAINATDSRRTTHLKKVEFDKEGREGIIVDPKTLHTKLSARVRDEELATVLDEHRQRVFDNAKARMDAGELQEARERFTELFDFPNADDSFRQRLHFNIALAWYYEDQHEEAGAEIRNGLKYQGPAKRTAIFSALLALLEDRPHDVAVLLEAYRYDDNDALRLIAQAQKEIVGRNAAIAALEECKQRDGVTALLLADYYSDAGRFNDAELLLRELISQDDDPILAFRLGTVLALSVMNKREGHQMAPYSLKREERIRVDEAFNLFKRAEGPLSKTQYRSLRLGLATNLGACASLLGNFMEAVRVADRGLELAPDDPVLLGNKLLALANNKQYREAGTVAERLYQCQKDESVLEKWAACEFNAQNFARLDEVFKTWERDFHSPCGEYYSVKSRYLNQAKHIESALSLLEEGLERHPDDPMILLEKGRLLAERKESGAEGAIRRAMDVAQGGEKYLARQELGLFLFQQKRWEEALPMLFRPDESEDPFNCPTIEEYLACLYNLGRFSECHQLMSDLLRGGIRPTARFADLASLVHLQRSDLGEALRFAREALLLQPSANRTLRMIELHLRLNQTELAAQEADSAISEYPDRLEVQVAASQTKFILGHYRDAFGHAQRAILLDSTNPIGHQYLIRAALQPVDLALSEEEKSQVRRSIDYLVERGDSNVWAVHFDENFTELKAMLRERSDRVDEYRRLYRDNQIPLSLIASIDGRSYYSIWSSCTAGDFADFRMARGSAEEQQREQDWATTRAIVTVDVSALYTLQLIGHLPLLLDVYREVRVPWRVYEIVRSEFEETRHNRAGGVMSYRKGDYVWEDIPETAYRRKQEFLQAILNFIGDDRISKVGLAADLLGDEAVRKVEQVIGEEFSHAVWDAKSSGSLYYGDDLATKDLARSCEGVSGICTQAFLRAAVAKGALTSEEYERGIGRLIAANYHFVSESDLVIWRHLADSGFEVNDFLRRLIGRIHLETINKEVAYRLLGAFTARVWFDVNGRGDGREAIVQEVGGKLATARQKDFENHAIFFLTGLFQELKFFPETIWTCVRLLQQSPRMPHFRATVLQLLYERILQLILALDEPGIRRTVLYGRFLATWNTYQMIKRLGLWRLASTGNEGKDARLKPSKKRKSKRRKHRRR